MLYVDSASSNLWELDAIDKLFLWSEILLLLLHHRFRWRVFLVYLGQMSIVHDCNTPSCHLQPLCQIWTIVSPLQSHELWLGTFVTLVIWPSEVMTHCLVISSCVPSISFLPILQSYDRMFLITSFYSLSITEFWPRQIFLLSFYKWPWTWLYVLVLEPRHTVCSLATFV